MNAVFITKNALEDLKIDGKIIDAEYSCNDGTREFAKELANSDSHIHLLSSDERLGRGKALNRAIKACSGDVICHIDADMPTCLNYLSELIGPVANQGCHVTIVSS